MKRMKGKRAQLSARTTDVDKAVLGAVPDHLQYFRRQLDKFHVRLRQQREKATLDADDAAKETPQSFIIVQGSVG